MSDSIRVELPLPLMHLQPEEDDIAVTSELVKPEISRTDRSIARRASLQILYELDTTDHSLAAVMDAHFYASGESRQVRPVIRRLVQGVLENKLAIDAMLQEYAPEFPIDQVAVIDRNILRMAFYEHLMQQRHTPVPVIVNEAVQLARRFGAEHAHSFVHGVLGALTADTAQEDAVAEPEPEAGDA